MVVTYFTAYQVLEGLYMTLFITLLNHVFDVIWSQVTDS